MGDFLYLNQLPISKLTAKGRVDITEARKILKFDESVSSPLVQSVMNKYSSLNESLEIEFQELFQKSDELNIDKLLYLGRDSLIKHHVIKQDNSIVREALSFPKKSYHTSRNYILVYEIAVYSNPLGVDLPAIINNVNVTGVSSQLAHLITIATLQETDLDVYRESIDFSDVSDPEIRKSQLNEIINELKEAKRRGLDVYAYSG